MSDQRDVVEVLTHDHREVEDLFHQLESASGEEQTAELMEQVTIELVRQYVAEEQWLYPAVREAISDGDRLADREITGHAEVEEVLKNLDGMKPDERDYSVKVSSLISNVRKHVLKEEGELFPRLVAVSTAAQLEDLGRKIEAAMMTAPSRPHPSAPSQPPGVGLVDRMLDALNGRG